jgi:hypothetical protein
MKKFLLGLSLVVIVSVGVAIASGFIKIGLGANAGSCQVGDEIAPSKRKEIESIALAFARAALNDKLDDVRTMMTKAAGSDKSVAVSLTAISRMAPFSDPGVAQTYRIESAGGGPDARAICGPLSNNQWVSVEIKPGLEQAHVLLSTTTRNNGWAFTIWLLPENGSWRVQYFHIGMASIAGRTPEMLLDMARKERDAGHAFNANMLYAGLQGAIDRGPAFQLGIDQPFRDDIAKFQAPAELRGKPPFNWTFGVKHYAVAQISIIGIGKDIGLVFVLPSKDWPGNVEIEKRNREFITAFIAGHPDYARDFTFLVARAMKPDNSGGFGTVYQNGKGFDG